MCTKALCFLLRKREFGGDVPVFYNAVLIPKSKNMAKSMADFSDYPAILFAMFRRGSISDPSGVDMAPCRSVAILLNREAGVFFRESPSSALRRISVYNHSSGPKTSKHARTCINKKMSSNNPVHQMAGKPKRDPAKLSVVQWALG